METITKHLSLLAICLILLHHQTAAAQESKGKDLIEKICAQTPNKDLCIGVLSSDPSSEEASLQELAMISLRVAAANATGILTDVKMMIDDPDLDPGIQQGLADCKETLLDAEGQLEDTVAALLTNAKSDAQLWLKAALAAIDTCDASIPGDDDILSRRSVGFRHLCNIAMTISKVMTNDA
ncbi:Pectinesterase inhibitor domain [Sesbania bispinosa]|nr:Pectinesterase inhibitor domain [Sesbania bispinosa]